MRSLPQWLLFKFEKIEGKAKLQKVPYYVNGKKRLGTQGDAADRRALVSFDVAVKRLAGSMHFGGLGFAFLPGDGLIGIDIDGAIDPDTGEISELCSSLIERCASYTERSPSGKGVHIIVGGTTKSFKSNDIGLEVFCGSQFFTCSGSWWQGSPADVQPIDEAVLAHKRELVEEAKGRKRAAAPSPPIVMPASASRNDLTGWLEQALETIDAKCDYDAWIGIGMAIKSALGEGGLSVWDTWSKSAGDGYAGERAIASHWRSFPGTDADGALVIFKMARKGNRWRPPDEYLAVYGADGEKARVARKKEGKAPLHLVPVVHRPDPPPDGLDERPEPPPLPHDGDQGAAGGAVVPLRGRKKKPPTRDKGGGGAVARLLQNFALRYGTDEVWDGEQRTTMQVKNLRLVFGTPYVNAWLAHPERRLLFEGQLAFEPGKELPEGHVNLFDGFAMTPIECTEDDVKPMLDLARHLCSLSARTKEGLERVFHQVMQWLAYPLQHPGAKLRFALVFHGPQGTGKNLFFDCVRSMYGKYGRMVGQTELEDKFNGYLSGKLMLIGNEVVTRQELFHHKNKLKWVITEPEIPIRGMHQEVRWESNHAQVVFLSNELQPVALEKDDRRHLVVYTPAAEDQDLYLRVADFLRNDGAAKWMHYLLKVDTEGFNEFTKPLMTEAKQSLIDLGLKPAERFANEWLDGFLELPLQVCSAEQLYKVFRKWCDLNGERGVWVPQAQFTKNVERHVFERGELDPDTGQRLPPRLHYKVVRCWLPRGTGPGPDQSEGEWAAAAIAGFETVAARFGRANYEEEDST